MDLIDTSNSTISNQKLFNPFRGTEYLTRGGYGHIFRLAIDTAVVVKIAHRIVGTGTTAGDEPRAAEALEILRRKRTVHEALDARQPPHPNIVEYFLSTDIAIFIKFEPETVERRPSRRFATPITEARQFLWIKEMASAASWLESLDYFHGDLRPENMLLDEAEHVKVVAGPEHEQFAIGSCIYTIRTGEVPYGQWETPEEFKTMYDALVQGQYPSTKDDGILGYVISSCWHSSYSSVAEVEAAIERAVGGVMLCEHESGAAPRSVRDHDRCVQKCREFLAQQGEGGQEQ
ncbi:hypothetical protein B0T22DRAFT_535295 [Podospora appendiculata]|uniref:EKC/KEOPS complex subunit BUD32 n=1 Tax=Podospora appendiculata TaxID=314037 RepID=A0AAE0X8X0_9PEZI|nr:hypothetical protein B0T22DRAFT_535295 [Podospora appendiculata]